jgi:hypothetical protein
VRPPPSPASAKSQNIRYNWQRFWVPQTGHLDLSDAGFLRDPADDYFGRDELRQIVDLEDYRALALLGEPGIGKSSELKREHDRIVAAADSLRQSLYVDLRVGSSEEGLRRRIFEAPAFTSWKEGTSHLCLHLDSFDEAVLRMETLASILAEELLALSVDRLSIRIACRTAVWPANILGTAFVDIWGDAAVGVFELAPLRRRDVLMALAAHGIDAIAFVGDLFGAHAVPFAIKPLTLDILIKIHQRHGALPSSAAELYRQGCLALAEEQNVSRRETRRLGHLNGPQRLRLACRIAAGTIIGGRVAVWMGAESDRPPEDIPASRLSGALEQGDFAAFTATDEDIREVLDTGLFSSRGDYRMGWAHQSYGEFLAALYLQEKRVPAETILRVLTHPSGGIIPQLAVVAAWTASLSAELRRSLIAVAPWELLRGDLANWSASDLELLTRAMLDYVEQDRYYDHFFGMLETYRKLAHDGLVAQLRPFIVTRSLKVTTRRVALNIAERCALKELEPEILEVALDQTEHSAMRAMAVSALRLCGTGSALQQLLALARGEAGDDPQDEIRGYALDLLWPEHIGTAEVFSLLTSSDPNFFGSFANFMFGLPVRLRHQDLLPALEWATGYISRANIMGEFREKRLADAVMFRVWQVFDDPVLTAPFVAHIEVRLHQYGDLCRGTDYKANEAFRAEIRSDVQHRQLFLCARLAAPLDWGQASGLRRADLLMPSDFAWLLSIAPGGSSPVAGLNEESLCNAIDVLFTRDVGLEFEALYDAAQHWPRLHTHFSWLLDGIALDSNEADRARSLLAQERRFAAMHRPQTVPNVDLSGEIRTCLERAESGDWQAWWKLNVMLARSPDHPNAVNDLDYIITDMPGWQSAADVTRKRIVATAPAYLANAESQTDSWFGRQPLTLNRIDLAALRALVLLHEQDRAAYSALPTSIWQKWAKVIVGLPRHGVVDKFPQALAVTQDALARAPAEFVGAVVELIRREKVLERSEAGHPNNGLRFHLLRDLEGCWEDEGLKRAIYGEMIAPDTTSAEYAVLLSALLAVGFQPAVDHVASILSTGGNGVLPIAKVLLDPMPPSVWPALWAKLVEDDDLARAIFLYAAGQFSLATPFYAVLGEEAIADLYLLMERLFPSGADGRGPAGFVAPQQGIPYLRDGAPRFLVSMGTEAAVSALRRLVAERPGLSILPFELSRAEITMRLKTWSPLSMREVFALTDRPDARLITSAADLMAVLLEVLDEFSSELHGAQTPVRDLWDRQGTTQQYRPIDENGFSDVVTRYLRRRLASTGVFANREVEVQRHPGAPIGTRTDILINTLRHSETGEPIDPITGVVEVKGCWNDELFTAIEAQLVRDYMVQLRAPVGIFLVGWFDLAKWDPQDSRRRTVPKRPVGTVREQLDQQAARAPQGFLVRSIITEIQAP